MEKYLVFIDNFSLLMPIITFLGIIMGICYFKRLNSGYKILVFLLIYSILSEILSYISAKLFGSNLFFINAYALVELILIYSFLRINNYPFKKISDLIFFLMLGFNFYEMFSIDYQNFDMFQVYSRSINSIFLLIISIIVIIKKLNDDVFDSSDKIYYALPCFLAINALLYLPLNILINFKDISVYVVWFTNALNVTIFFSIIIYQIWKFGRRQKT